VQHVGARELRSNLASFLERASRGEEFVVTEHGKPIARVVPVDPSELVLARLAAEGRLRRGRRPRRPLPPPIPVEDDAISEILIEHRGGTVWRPTSTLPPSSS
jgi:prevent-host-death family protein